MDDYAFLRVEILLPFGEEFSLEHLHQYLRTECYVEPEDFGEIGYLLLSKQETSQGNSFRLAVFMGRSSSKATDFVFPKIPAFLLLNEKNFSTGNFKTEQENYSYFWSIKGHKLVELWRQPKDNFPLDSYKDFREEQVHTDRIVKSKEAKEQLKTLDLSLPKQKKAANQRAILIHSVLVVGLWLLCLSGLFLKNHFEVTKLKNQINAISSKYKKEKWFLEQSSMQELKEKVDKNKDSIALYSQSLLPWELSWDSFLTYIGENKINAHWSQFRWNARQGRWVANLQFESWAALEELEKEWTPSPYLASLSFFKKTQNKEGKISVVAEGGLYE